MNSQFSFARWGIVLLAASAVHARSAAQERGPKVGKKAPSFALKGQDGKVRTLKDLTQSGKVALVFHRSASW